MSPSEWIVLATVIGALVLFISEKLSIDLVALLVALVLTLTGIITPQEAVAGFSDAATLTVAFMFVLSAALLRTGALSTIGPRLGPLFREGEARGLAVFMLAIGAISAFINNTPIVAVFIPIAVQMARSARIHPGKLLIPLSFGTIMGGTCTLIGTSTNIVVSGLAQKLGVPAISMFQMAPMGIVFLLAGVAYMVLVGRHLLPGDRPVGDDLGDQFGMGGYLTEIELLSGGSSVGKRIMDSPLVRDMEMDIIAIQRGDQRFNLPSGDMVLEAGDLLKVRCDVARIRAMKDRAQVSVRPSVRLADDDLRARGTTLVELVITASSPLEGKTLREADLIRAYRAVPLAVRHREEVVHDRLHDVVLRSGDVVLAEVRSHYVGTLQRLQRGPDAPFAILARQDGIAAFDRGRFALVTAAVAAVVVLSSLNVLPVMVAALAAVVFVVLTGCLSMKDVYEAIEWKIVFLMAGSFSLGIGMHASGLDARLAGGVVDLLRDLGPAAVLSGLYLFTSLLTELMSNTATAALITPIAIQVAGRMDSSPTPFLMAVAFAASASFMTPIGYQTNAMVYSAGRYRYTDFLKVGAPLHLLFWLLATFLIPVFYPL
ncbi:MAG: SLC13 family permease [Flavobacteriales bacterium]|nr:SLC13 family permease [Flavobacteriales bacterium]